MFRWLFPSGSAAPTLASRIAAEDARLAAEGRIFARSNRPLVHWVAQDGYDAALLREAIHLTTEALGADFDYALTTDRIGARRARSILELACQPVDWRDQGDSHSLAARLRPRAPELILAANVVLRNKPDCLSPSAGGAAEKRVSVDPPVTALPAEPDGQPDVNEAESRPFSQADLEAMQVLHEAPRRPAPDTVARFAWLGGSGQWGIPGWSIADALARLVAREAAPFAGRTVLEIGTSRGRLTAIMASLGCHVITVDHQDRGARANLDGLPVEVVQDDFVAHLGRRSDRFDLIVCDLHGNSPAEWKRYRRPLLRALAQGGKMILNNAALHRLPDWQTETGVAWFLSRLPKRYQAELYTDVLPGIAIITSR